MLRVVRVQPMGYQVPSGQRVVVGVGTPTPVAQDADRVTCQHARPEPCLVLPVVAPLAGGATCLLGLVLALVAS